MDDKDEPPVRIEVTTNVVRDMVTIGIRADKKLIDVDLEYDEALSLASMITEAAARLLLSNHKKPTGVIH